MTKPERHERLMSMIAQQPDISVPEMSRAVGVSEVTIRKDLTQMAEEGKVKRSYGKVSLIRGTIVSSNTSCFIPPEYQNDYIKKQQIGLLAAEMVSDEDFIYIGPGYTCLEVANNLRRHQRLSIITTNVSAAIELSEAPEFKLMLAPGDFTKRNGTYYVTGPSTAKYMEDLFVDKVFITADGISLERGLSILDEVTGQIFKTLIKPSTKVIVCAVGSKFSRNALTVLGDLSFANAIVTDVKPNDEFMEYFETHGIEVLYPGK